MAKFKVGDRVRVTYRATYWCGEGEVVVANNDCYNVRYDDGKVGGFHECDLELLEPNGPIRTITRREIVPGSYGCVEVQRNTITDSPAPFVRFYAQANSEELRSAAHIFNEIADVLDEQKEAA